MVAVSPEPVMDVLRLFAGRGPYVVRAADGGWIVRQDGKVVAHVNSRDTADRVAAALR